MKEYDRQYYIRNRERLRRLHKEYYIRNREMISDTNSKWRKRNPYRVKRYNRKYYSSDRGKQSKKRSNDKWTECKLNYARSDHGKHIRRCYQQSISGLDVIKRNGVEYRDKLRLDLFEIIGSTCVSCGHDDIRVLQFDHIYDDGATERKRFSCSRALLIYYRQHPDEARKRLQTLCANCNWAKRYKKLQTPIVL